MIVYADNVEYTRRILPVDTSWYESSREFGNAGLNRLASEILSAEGALHTARVDQELWQYLFIVERASKSHYDVIVDLCRNSIDLPDKLLCLAGSGDLLHGQRNRPWVALPGNIHLTTHLTPNMATSRIGRGFSVLAAVSMIDTIDRIGGLAGRAGIKWVNDIVIDDAKVAGFITHTVNFKDIVGSAIVGIGMNVETTPPVTPDRFFYRGAALRNFLPDAATCDLKTALSLLLDTLASNYERLQAGDLTRLLDTYRSRSVVIGREVEILPDSPHRVDEAPIRGVVTEIGDNLELVLKGRKEPITRGRLVLL